MRRFEWPATNTGSADPEYDFGVIRTDGTWKPAAYLIQQLAASSATTPSMARMALAMPDAPQGAPADLVALAAVAEPTDPAALAAPALAAQPETPMAAAMTVAQTSMQAGMAVASSVATLNPVAVAMTTLSAAAQVAGTTLQDANGGRGRGDAAVSGHAYGVGRAVVASSDTEFLGTRSAAVEHWPGTDFGTGTGTEDRCQERGRPGRDPADPGGVRADRRGDPGRSSAGCSVRPCRGSAGRDQGRGRAVRSRGSEVCGYAEEEPVR